MTSSKMDTDSMLCTLIPYSKNEVNENSIRDNHKVNKPCLLPANKKVGNNRKWPQMLNF